MCSREKSINKTRLFIVVFIINLLISVNRLEITHDIVLYIFMNFPL